MIFVDCIAIVIRWNTIVEICVLDLMFVQEKTLGIDMEMKAIGISSPSTPRAAD